MSERAIDLLTNPGSPQPYQTARYNAVAIGLHWTIALLAIANWPIGYFGEALKHLFSLNLVGLHKSLGLTVLGLSLVRLVWRLGHRQPDPPPLSRSRLWLAHFTQGALYLLLVAVPLSGWLRASSGTYPLKWFGIIDVPKFPIVPQSCGSVLATEAHKLLAWFMLVFAAVHVAAALYHHLYLRDRLLLRIMPWRPT